MKAIELYTSKAAGQDLYGNVFGKNFVWIKDILAVQANSEYSFFKRIESNKDSYFVYCLCDTKQNIVKFGRSNYPFKRMKSHISNFCCYGGSAVEDLQYSWSRFAFHKNHDIEKELLNSFRGKYSSSPQIAKEFFTNIDSFSATMFFGGFLNSISYKKYE
jgi:hypothetical protein